MKRRTAGKLGIAIAILEHPAVQEAGRKLATAVYRKARKWMTERASRKALKELPPERKRSSSKKKTRQKKKSASPNKKR